MDDVEVAGWVHSSNVFALFTWLSLYVDYRLDASDWQAIEDALPRTDDRADKGWYSYPLIGTPPLQVSVARCEALTQ